MIIREFPELPQLCNTWQERLKLRDWDVTVQVLLPDDMDDNWGHVEWNLQEKTADIKLAHPDYAKGSLRPYSLETTLVHELLHLHFAAFAADSDSLEELAQEQAINAIASSLIKLSRACHET